MAGATLASGDAVLGRLDAVLSDLLEQDLAGLPGEALAERVLHLQRATNRMNAALVTSAAAFDVSGTWELDGAASAGAWLRARANLAPGAARTLVREGRLLRDALPLTLQALAEGAITVAHVRVLTAVCEKNAARRDAVTGAESILVRAARTLDPTGLRQVVDRWTCAVDPVAAATDDADRYAARWLSVSRTFGGMVAVDGLLDPEGGSVLLAALDALADRHFDGEDGRTPRQRRADALTEAARHVLDHGDLPRAGGQRPHVMITIPEHVMRGRGTGGAELDRVGPVTADAALRLLCDSQMTPVLTDERGVVLDVGRARRTIPPSLRRAIIVRDEHCVFAGCERPPQWCEVHHVRPWADGGVTSLTNCVLLCRRHHRALHHDGYALVGTPGIDLTTHRPDGSVIRLDGVPGAPPRPPPRAPSF